MFGEFGVVAAEGTAVGIHPVPRRGTRHVGAVPAGSIALRTAVERIVIGLRGRTRVESIVVVTHEVDAANHFGPVDKP